MSSRSINRRMFLGALGCGGCALLMKASGCTIAEVYNTGGGSLTFNLAEQQYAPLAEINGVVPVEVAGRPVLLIRTDDSTIVALNRICTHTQCDMEPQASGRWDGEKLICTCHDSHFGPDGTVLQGPATRDLATYPGTFDAASGAGMVVVGDTEEEDTNPVPPEFRDMTSPFDPDDSEALAAGKEIWDTNCAFCHGEVGEGNDSFPPPTPTIFTGDNSVYRDDYLFWRLRTGSMSGPEGSIMPAYDEATYSDEQIWQVLTYLRSLGQ
ncbi:MAG: Rieske 2Fe-2S domain-containing protein [Myxococcota bacterium]